MPQPFHVRTLNLCSHAGPEPDSIPFSAFISQSRCANRSQPSALATADHSSCSWCNQCYRRNSLWLTSSPPPDTTIALAAYGKSTSSLSYRICSNHCYYCQLRPSPTTMPTPPASTTTIAGTASAITGGYKGLEEGYEIPAGTDIFISVYNLHRSPYFWDQPNEFEPERFLIPKTADGIKGWKGFDPTRSPGAFYPNEIMADFSFLPFGGGQRKCVGDQFALLEATVALALLLQKFDVELKGSPDDVKLVTGATIHTKNGLWCRIRGRTKALN